MITLFVLINVEEFLLFFAIFLNMTQPKYLLQTLRTAVFQKWILKCLIVCTGWPANEYVSPFDVLNSHVFVW